VPVLTFVRMNHIAKCLGKRSFFRRLLFEHAYRHTDTHNRLLYTIEYSVINGSTIHVRRPMYVCIGA